MNRNARIRSSPSNEGLKSAIAAAKFLTISVRTLKALTAQGAIPAIRVSPRRIAFDPRDLNAYIERQRR